MEILIIIAMIVLLVILYFAFGMIIKFIWGWLPLALGLLLGLIIGINGGWLGAILGLFTMIASVVYTNSWHSSALFFKIEEKIEKRFYFKE